ncbi:MAG TPA: PIG-L family deacetylase [Candidatus Acidoferrum sp.]|nr:PIG-L family deacetylase [Candidatus Acidoferrum sp.]
MKFCRLALARSTRRSVICFLSFLAFALPANAQFPPAPGTGTGLPETIEAIEDARVTTRILYITAHPDDESAAVLTYLARGLHADVALLSLTRGEGGQNDLGPEQAPQLGLIRSQELLAATRGYGVKLFFTRAKDFGYSKTPEETEKVWGNDVLQDMVEIIRTFRPTVVINGWGGVHSGHGHHQAAGLLTPKAVQLAADPNFKVRAFSSASQDTAPWGDRRPILLLDVDRGEKPQGYSLPLDDVSPLYGKSWREIGLDAFASHHTQGITGFLNSPFLRRPVTLKREDGADLAPASLNEPLGPLDEDFEVGNRGVDPLMRSVDASLLAAREAALRLDWKSAADALIAAAEKLDQIPLPALSSQTPPPVQSLFRSVHLKREKINAALALVCGLRLNAIADRSDLVPGESFTVRVEPRHRESIGGDFGKISLIVPQDWSIPKEEPEPSGAIRFTVSIPPASRLPQNSSEWFLWSQRLPGGNSAHASPALLAEPPPLITATQEVMLNGYSFTDAAPVTSVHATSTRADRIPPRLVPAFTIAVEPQQVINILGKPAPRKPFQVLLRVHSYATQRAKVIAGLDAPRRWSGTPPISLNFTGTGDQYARFQVTPPSNLAPGSYKISAHVFDSTEHNPVAKDPKFSLSLEPLPTMPTILWAEPAECLVRAFAINVPKDLRVGYITAESEPVPDALRMLGIQVDLLDAQALAFRDLSKFDAIVVGVRAYELRPDLPGANQRLLEYASKGGTLLVQYQRDFAWDRSSYAPYPALISPPATPAKEGSAPVARPLPRITDENSPVKFLKPHDPLLNHPNKISPSDFKGWVQERGLYFLTQFDAKYTPLLAMNDPGEPDLKGALVYTRYGKGTYIYTGIAFFRQLPEGVPGAYRLFVNLLSASRPPR